MHKQHVPFEGVYDIFAIRIIIDCPQEAEKSPFLPNQMTYARKDMKFFHKFGMYN
jgi:hypothetical protein